MQAGVDVSHMYCHSANGGQCLLRALTARNVADIPCEQIQRSLDILAESVLSCSARAAIYKCVKTKRPYVVAAKKDYRLNISVQILDQSFIYFAVAYYLLKFFIVFYATVRKLTGIVNLPIRPCTECCMCTFCSYYYYRITDSKNVAVYGTLVDQLEDDAWNLMPNVNCTLSNHFTANS